MLWLLILKISLVLLWVFKWRWPMLVLKKYRSQRRQMPVIQRSGLFSNRLPIIVGWLNALCIIAAFFELGTLKLPEWSIFVRIAGSIALLLGLAMQILATQQLGPNYASQVVVRKGQQLVTSGLYRYQRHPIYFGEILIYAGMSLSLLSYLGLGFTLFVYLPILSYRSKIEERQLIKKFGNYYRNYRMYVSKFFPGY